MGLRVCMVFYLPAKGLIADNLPKNKVKLLDKMVLNITYIRSSEI